MRKWIGSSVFLHIFSITFCFSLFIFLSSPVLAENTETVFSLLQRGKKLQEEGRHIQALEFFRKATTKKENFADAYFAMGISYYKLHRLKSSIRSFEKVLSINPESTATHNNLAVIYAELGNYRDALEEVKTTIRLNSKYKQGHLNLADLYLSRSIQEYLEVIRDNPEKNRKVRNRLRHLLESDPENPEFQYQLGILSRIEGHNEEAVKRFQSALRLDPSYSDRAYLALGDLFEKQGKLKKAFIAYKTLLDRSPENDAAAFAAGRIKNRDRDYATAEDLLKRAASLHPTPDVDYELGQAQQGLGKNQEAIASYQRSLRLKDRPETRFALGQALKSDMKYPQAIKEFESILKTYPNRERIKKEILEITQARLTQSATKKTATRGRESRQIPAPLVRLKGNQDYALLVDKSTQMLRLYREQKERIVLLQSFACSTGENHGEKHRPGDKKTPEGIYRFTGIRTGRDLPPRYGKLAFPLDYPNLFDRKKGRDGNGIWLHATNEPLRAYLPNKTLGCIVISNKDIQTLARIIRPNDTPIIIYDKIPLARIDEQTKLRKRILNFVSAWKKSWEDRDLDRFIGFYASGFTHKGRGIKAWRTYKRKIFKRSGKISIRLTPYRILRYKEYLTVSFLQKYRSERHADKGIKRLFLIQEKNQWRIAGEEWRPI